ncbi:PREDICTED: multiple epidermal growth factor-like domains protein 10 [Cyprinodon variegatus]|uniref:multiple epidermal growth factor-like domains protein 10 n=1 Tax=Cyprinodon variegatus TaxID=28743 RepID=UPI00074269F8|nr:PREDICTED: multiple epidermal growth factor-like domains protein 10 [Cyprinodon variegatus]
MNAIRDMVKTADYLSSSYSLASSENPYATIKDPPLPTSRNTECSYMEMKPPTRRDSSYAEISNSQRVDEADMSAETFPSSGAAFEHQQLGEELFDQAKNSSCDYDLLPPRKDNYSSEPKEVDRD